MKRATRKWLELYPTHAESRDILDSDARQRDVIRRLRADVKRKDAALISAVAEFDRRGLSPWTPRALCDAALRPAKAKRKTKS